MKANRYITAMLIPAFIGTLTINAQSANSRSSKDRTRTTNTRPERGDQSNRQTAYKTSERTNQSAQKATPRQTKSVAVTRENKQNNTRTYQGNSNKTNNNSSIRTNQGNGHKTNNNSNIRTNQGNSKRTNNNSNIRANQGNAHKTNNNSNIRTNQGNSQRTNQYANTRNSSYRDPKHVSVSNNHNPRSTYAKPSKTVYTYDKKHHNKASHTNYNKHYYGGKHYHHAYPTRSVKMNYHYDTHHHNYRTLYYPAHMDIYWSRGMYRDYARMYPSYNYWHYGYGHRISTISTFETAYNMGEVARVYGRVYSTWYNQDTDDFLLLFGGDYPQQNFTVVIPGKVARRYSWRPEQYFLGKHITTTGLITSFEGKPEMVVKQKGQIMLY